MTLSYVYTKYLRFISLVVEPQYFAALCFPAIPLLRKYET